MLTHKNTITPSSIVSFPDLNKTCTVSLGMRPCMSSIFLFTLDASCPQAHLSKYICARRKLNLNYNHGRCSLELGRRWCHRWPAWHSGQSTSLESPGVSGFSGSPARCTSAVRFHALLKTPLVETQLAW